MAKPSSQTLCRGLSAGWPSSQPIQNAPAGMPTNSTAASIDRNAFLEPARGAAPALARRWSSMTRLREGKAVLFLYAGLQPVERSEGARDLHESLESALLHDQVSLSDGGQTVRDDERGTPGHQALEALHD